MARIDRKTYDTRGPEQGADQLSEEQRAKVAADARLLLCGMQSLAIEVTAMGLPAELISTPIDNATILAMNHYADTHGITVDAISECLNASEGDNGDFDGLLEARRKLVAEAESRKA